MKSVLYLGCPSAEQPVIERRLASAGLSVIWADDPRQALTELQQRDLPVLVDLAPGAGALQAARELRAQRGSTLMFAVADARRPDLTIEAMLAGMGDVFTRPPGGRRIINAIEREAAYVAQQPWRACDVTVDDLYDHSPAMREVIRCIERAAAEGAGVLLRGEDGSGRQLVARAVHAGQDHRNGRFVTVDCAAFGADELDVELFGVTTRSENGHLARGLERISRKGRLHEALGGTLYLQNVIEAPTRIQARLARLLRDGEALLVETDAAITVDARPMAGVDPDFDRAVREGRLREDLYRRLCAIRIDVPPLRDRREDIPALANYFLREICGAMCTPPKTLSRSALLLISALPWRGNAVELKTVLERVVASAREPGVLIEDMLAHVRFDGNAVAFANGETLRQARARFEREHIAAVLQQCQGRMSEAAKALGIQRTNLYRKLRTLRVSRERRG